MLSASSRVCLQYVQQCGSCATSDLVALQRRLPGGAARTKASVNGTSYNLHVQGYLRRKPGDSSQWELTEKGRHALIDVGVGAAPAAQPCEAEPERARTVERSTQPEAPSLPARSVGYAGRSISLPIAPRWVFDFGAFLP